jgi:molecular chaperone GrpE
MEEKHVPTELNGQQDIVPPARDDTQAGVETIEVEGVPALTDALHGIPALLEEMQSLRQDFETKVKYDESKERLIDTLHKELQAYREGLHFKILRPVFIDLISMYDDFAKVVDALQKKSPDASADQEIQNLQSFQEMIEEILRRNGVESFEVEEDLFLGSKQRILRTIETMEPTLDKRIARRVRRGFAYENRVLRPEVVEVYKYAAPS